VLEIAYQKDALGQTSTERRELLWVLQEIDDLFQFLILAEWFEYS